MSIIIRVELIVPKKHPAMGAAEYPRADYSAQPATGDPAYTFEDMTTAVRIIRDGKAMRVPHANIGSIWEGEEKPAAKAARRA